MTDPQDREDALRAAQRLEETMGALSGEIRKLRAYSKRSRYLIRLVVGAFALCLLLVGGLGLVAWQAHTASNRATVATSAAAQNRQAQRNSCEAGNQARALQVQLWTYALDLSQRTRAQTQSQKAQTEQFREYLRTVFAPRNCAETGH